MISQYLKPRFSTILMTALLISSANAQTLLDVTYGPMGELGSLTAYTNTGLTFAFVDAVQEGEAPLLLLVSSENGVRRVIIDETGGVSFEAIHEHAPAIDLGNDSTVFDENERRKIETRIAGEALGTILAIQSELGTSRTPRFILDVADTLAKTSQPKRLQLISQPLPPVVVMGCGARDLREECDDCCDSEFDEDRKDCRDSWSPDNPADWQRQQRCMQQAVLKLGNCSLMCSLKPTNPPKPPTPPKT